MWNTSFYNCGWCLWQSLLVTALASRGERGIYWNNVELWWATQWRSGYCSVVWLLLVTDSFLQCMKVICYPLIHLNCCSYTWLCFGKTRVQTPGSVALLSSLIMVIMLFYLPHPHTTTLDFSASFYFDALLASPESCVISEEALGNMRGKKEKIQTVGGVPADYLTSSFGLFKMDL